MPDSKPNVLIILADDIGWFDISCYHPELLKPQGYAATAEK